MVSVPLWFVIISVCCDLCISVSLIISILAVIKYWIIVNREKKEKDDYENY